MSTEPVVIDIDHMPDVVHIVEEAERASTLVTLRIGGRPVARIVPGPATDEEIQAWRQSPEKMAALWRAFGSMPDWDVDTWIEDNYRQRELGTKAPIDL
jgi:hypothetical protein